LFGDVFAEVLPTFSDFLVKSFVDFYAAFVDLNEFSVSSEASQNGCLCHSYCIRSQYLD